MNLDGKVTIADLEESIGQMGSNPGASDTMPVADINKDGIIDELDIALALQQFGEQTDAFEGLWEDSPLWSIAAGGSGFGSIPGAITPGGSVQPRPLDDCIFIFDGPDSSVSILPHLLQLDLRTNCVECPDCDHVTSNCYQCENSGTLTPPSITLDNSEPDPGEPVTFTIGPARISGRTIKCISVCGDEGTICAIPPATICSTARLQKRNSAGEWMTIATYNECDPIIVT